MPSDKSDENQSGENQEVRAMDLTWADRMEAKYFEAWSEKVRQLCEATGEEKVAFWWEKGRQAGRREEAREFLLRLLEQRFGPLPPRVRHRIQGMDTVYYLHRLADQALGAGSLEEMRLV